MKQTGKKAHPAAPQAIPVERVQTGIRLEKRLLKVLKGLAEYHDLYVGDLLEGIVLHAFDGKSPFGKESLDRIRDLKRIYGLDLDASASHRLIEKSAGTKAATASKRAKRREQKGDVSI
jgi:hypothetical protein